jgi:Fe-S cluster biogenesis protein NfuA|tara:strand:+ start:462 stop:713 length:252 start_codon:yes stop_codon:yes gene_type:complete
MTQIQNKIHQIFEEDINPSLEMHAGSAAVRDINITDNKIKIKIKFQGSCVGCPSSETATLSGIQAYLEEEIQDYKIVIIKEDD